MLIFDFDGVLVGSLDEVTLTAYNSISKEFVSDVSHLPSGFAQLFKRNRFHVQPPGDFLPFAEWCLKNCGNHSNKTLDENEFKALLASVKEDVKIRTERFFATRSVLIAKDKNYWLNLHSPYQPLWSKLKTFDCLPFPILTLKNRSAVLELTNHFQLNINPDSVFSGDHGATKHENFQKLTKRYPASQYYFIDDSIKNLSALLSKHARTAPLKGIFATWGYTGPEDKTFADSLGVECFTQGDLINFLDSNPQLTRSNQK